MMKATSIAEKSALLRFHYHYRIVDANPLRWRLAKSQDLDLFLCIVPHHMVFHLFDRNYISFLIAYIVPRPQCRVSQGTSIQTLLV